jgi:hypothetical protein
VEEYREAEKHVKNMIRNAKRKFERDIAKGCGSERVNKRRFFSYIKQRTKSRTGIGPLKDGHGKTVQDDQDQDMAERFFQWYLHEGGYYKHSGTTTNWMQARAERPEYYRERREGQNQKAESGRGGRTGRAGSSSTEEIGGQAGCAAGHSNEGVTAGRISTRGLAHSVMPIYKKGPKSEPGNYRPVSLTSVTCRLMEGILKDQIVKHLERQGLIRAMQHGFMRGRSCTTNLLSFFEKITSELDSGKVIDVIYLDFAKAFDTVPHKRLKKKLKAHGIGGNVLKWITAWLSGRKQRVVLNGKESSWEEVLSGVPQGSVLGPLLFTIFINDLDLAVSDLELLLKFADDTKMSRVIDSDADRAGLQDALNKQMDWSNMWGMKFTVSKCKVMHMGRGNAKSDYEMAGTVLEKSREEKDLGVIVQDTVKQAA